jgi:twitching motility protein PilT
VRAALDPRAGIADFAQKFIDEGIVEDIPALEKLASLAMLKAQKGPPASDPFTVDDEDDDSVPLIPKKAPAVPAPTFPFATIGALDDGALAAALRELLKGTARYGASDLHLSTGTRPFIRKNRNFDFLSDHPLTAEESLRLNTALLSEGQKKIFLERKDYDYALALSNTDRYRVNLMFHKNGAAGAYRMVPEKVRTLADLGFDAHNETLKKLLSYHNGLILITGPVGSGKTTTLASMVAYLNETRTDHIITVEDPIEVVQASKGCNVTQREVGPHTKSFATALKGALREDPDVIVIGELRDLETIEMAISASETGHLVIGTMHTSDAATTLNRLLDVFPPAQQTQIRSSVAESLRGVICQRLLPAYGGGLTLACEILINNTAIANLIKEGKSQGLRNTMETGVREGMCLMDNVVFQLSQSGKISSETALANITNRVLRARITP